MIFLLQTGTDLANANLVYLPYCSSDAHMADTKTHLVGYGDFQMRGRRMAHHAVDILVGPQKKDQINIYTVEESIHPRIEP